MASVALFYWVKISHTNTFSKLGKSLVNFIYSSKFMGDIMSGFEEKRDKIKAFKASQKNVDAINDFIKKSGENDIEFFEELVNDFC